MNIIEVEIASLIPDPANARRHPQKNLDAIKGSLARFGLQKPIVITTENVVIAGNGTLEAAKFLGWKTIQCVRTDLKGSQLTAYGLADNRSSDLGEYDMVALGALLHGLREEDFDLTEIGFDTSDLDNILVDTPPEPDDPSEPVEKTKHTLTVVFEDDVAQQELFLELRDRGFKVKV